MEKKKKITREEKFLQERERERRMRMWKKSSSRNWNTLNPHWIHNNISKTLPIVRESSQGGGDSWSIQRQSHGIHSRLACKSRFEENPLFPLPPPFHHSMIHHSSYREDNFKLTLSPWNYIANFTFRIFPSNSKIFSHFYARLLFFLFVANGLQVCKRK